MAVLIVEQKVREVLKIARRVYVLRNGQVSFSGATDAALVRVLAAGLARAVAPATGLNPTVIMGLISCPYLGSEVELTDEREQHVAEQHPDLLPAHRQKMADTLTEPDQVRRSTRFGNTRLFSRWFAELRGGKHVVVVVVSRYSSSRRHWIITAYIARGLAGGEIEWKKN